MKKETTIKEVYWFFCFLIILILVLLILGKIEYSTLFQESGKSVFSDCQSHELSISNESIFHHVLLPCTQFIEQQEGIDDKNKSYQKQDYDTKVQINSWGFRNKEFDKKKTENALRIVLLGDSYVYGYGLNQEETFYAKLEEKLKEKTKKKIEVWNIGVPSWATPIHYLVTKEIVTQIDPDQVILLFDESDYYDNYLYDKMKEEREGQVVAIPQDNLGDGWKYYNARADITKETFKGTREEKKQKHENLQKISLNYVSDINTILQEKNISFTIITYPYYTEDENFEQVYLSFFYQELEQEGITHLSLYPQLIGKKEYYSSTHLHWNDQGSTKVADLLSAHVLSEISE